MTSGEKEEENDEHEDKDESERDWVLHRIRALARVGVATSRIAVLYRTHAIGKWHAPPPLPA